MSWQKVGEVVDAVGSGRKQLYQGKEYDYVFDVDVQEGAPPLKLPYNANGSSAISLDIPCHLSFTLQRTLTWPLNVSWKVTTSHSVI